MVKQWIFILGIALCTFSIAWAQEQEGPFVRKGLLKATATISPGTMLNRAVSNIYVPGELEYFLENKVSVRGDCYWYLNSQQKPDFMKQNSMIFFGALYHFSKKKSDFFLGLQPAAILAQPNMRDSSGTFYPARIDPGVSLIAGYTFYVWDYCNFYLNARYVTSRYTGTSAGTLQLDEIMFSGGLGFQLHTRKKSRPD